MALPVEKQIRYWSIAAVVLFVVLWSLGNVLLPFVLGAAVAYLLDPVADRLERMGLSRMLSVAIISVCFLLVVVFIGLAVLPSLVRQSIGLVNAAPELVSNLRTFLDAHIPGGLNPDSAAGGTLAALGDSIKEKGAALLNTVLTSAVSVVNVLLLFFVVPVVSVYLLVDWDELVARIDRLLPRDHAPVIRRLAGEIDQTLASFIRGQGLVCLIQGTFYAVALMAAGLNFGLVIGALAGMLAFIPLVGSIVGGVLAIGLALFQFWGDWFQIALIAGIFFFGQIVEGNVLTPKLVGSSVGLHPVWLLLALSVFGTLFGFVGMLVAVPLAAALGVLVRFAASEYLQSRLYRGHEGLRRDDTRAQDTAAE